jgi:hypothetical protein
MFLGLSGFLKRTLNGQGPAARIKNFYEVEKSA